MKTAGRGRFPLPAARCGKRKFLSQRGLTIKRILVVSDPAFPLSTTGFAMPCRAVIDGLMAAGFRVIHLARGSEYRDTDLPKEWDGKPIKIFGTPVDDLNGYHYLGYLLDVEANFDDVDCIVYIADPQSIRAWRTNVQARMIFANKPRPTVTYGPTEGGPLLKPESTCLAEIITTGGIVSTYTQFSADVMTRAIKKAMVPGKPCPDFQIRIIPHGVDHAPFRQFSPIQRADVRKRFGWTDKIVVMNVARNSGRKMWPSLFKAISLLGSKYPNLILYAHTAPFERFFLEGHNLSEIANNLDIDQRVIYPDRSLDPWHGVPFERLIAAYNAADIFVTPSGAEGWNLPVSEAAACGLPVICTTYSGMWEQARDYAIPLEPDGYTTHSNGSELAYVSPHQIADKIEQYAIMCPEKTKSYVTRGLEISKLRTWQLLKEGIVKMVKEAIGNLDPASTVMD